MIVVALSELILDDHGAAIVVNRDKINAEISCRPFTLSLREGKIKHIIEHVEIVAKPTRKIMRLVFPDLTNRNPSNFSNHRNLPTARREPSFDKRPLIHPQT